jgi:hypothetical protein
VEQLIIFKLRRSGFFFFFFFFLRKIIFLVLYIYIFLLKSETCCAFIGSGVATKRIMLSCGRKLTLGSKLLFLLATRISELIFITQGAICKLGQLQELILHFFLK